MIFFFGEFVKGWFLEILILLFMIMLFFSIGYIRIINLFWNSSIMLFYVLYYIVFDLFVFYYDFYVV